MRESSLDKTIIKELSRGDARLFRNVVGMGWQGNVVRHEGGVLVLANPRPIHAGLFNGSADLIGWQRRIITPDMVGQAFAQFASIEDKVGKGKLREDQKTWRDIVLRFGGIAGVARSVEDARAILGGAIILE